MVSVSFIICTIERSGREERLRRVVQELKRQACVDYEVILVFQGEDRALLPVSENDGVKVVLTSLCSSAESRNRGAAIASRDLLCFLDDDTYPVHPDFCLTAAAMLQNEGLDFVNCNIDSDGDVQSGAPITHDVDLTLNNLIGNMWEPGFTIRRDAFNKVRFDPTLGIACLHGSSEGLDFGVRLNQAGYKGKRVAKLLIDHPPLDKDYRPRVERLFFYSLGNGSVLIQHGYYRQYAWQLFKAFVRMIVSLVRGDKTRSAASLVRMCCLMAGPFLPRHAARILPPKRE